LLHPNPLLPPAPPAHPPSPPRPQAPLPEPRVAHPRSPLPPQVRLPPQARPVAQRLPSRLSRQAQPPVAPRPRL